MRDNPAKPCASYANAALGAIDFKDVRFTYDGVSWAINGVTTHVQPGEFVCLLGGNGSGKSTLAKHINALLLPDEGEVYLDSWNTSDEQVRYFIRSTAGMVFQNPDDQIVASIVENDVAFGPENLGVPAPEIKERITKALEAVGLSGFEKAETATLSGGQKQRVALAGVLTMKPRILILDEATAMIDPQGRAQIMHIVQHLNTLGFTVVMITHFMEEAMSAQRILVMHQGRIALEGTPEQMLTNAEQLRRMHLDVPFMVRLSRACQSRGIPVSTTLNPQTLKDELCSLLLNV